MYKFNNAQKTQVATFRPHPVFNGIEALHTRFKTIVENNRAAKVCFKHIDDTPTDGHIAMVINCHPYEMPSGLLVNEMTANLCITGTKSSDIKLPECFTESTLKIDKIKGQAEIENVATFWAPQIANWDIRDGDIIVLVYTKNGKTHSAKILYGEPVALYKTIEKVWHNTINKSMTTERTYENEP